MSGLSLAAHLPAERRSHVESRLHDDPIGWLTTVSRAGRPYTVPVWFELRDDETLVLFSRPGKQKLRNIEQNPSVTLVLDGTDGGGDVVRLDGTAQVAADHPGAYMLPTYVAKYAQRIASAFGTPEHFAELYSVPVVVTVTALHA